MTVMGEPVEIGRRHIGYVPQVVEFDHDFPISVWDVARNGPPGPARPAAPLHQRRQRPGG